MPDYEDEHRIAFELLSKYIQMSIVDGENAELLTSLLSKYKSYPPLTFENYPLQKLSNKILDYFLQLSMAKLNNKNGNLIYNKDTVQNASSPDFYVKEAAMQLRASVLQVMATVELPTLSNVEAVKNGEVKPSDIIVSFFSNFNIWQLSTLIIYQKKMNGMQSLAQDMVFTVLHGKLKPANL